MQFEFSSILESKLERFSIDAASSGVRSVLVTLIEFKAQRMTSDKTLPSIFKNKVMRLLNIQLEQSIDLSACEYQRYAHGTLSTGNDNLNKGLSARMSALSIKIECLSLEWIREY